MSSVFDQVKSGRARRRTVLQLGGAAGVLLGAGIPSYVLADSGDQGDQGAGQNPLRNIPVSGTSGSDNSGTFNGQFTVTSFYSQGTNVFANGFLSGVVKGAGGGAQHIRDYVVTAVPVSFNQATSGAQPAAAAAATSCTVLNLVLGPLSLDLLGLFVTIPIPIVINITAVQGAGLLGDLLCAVDNLLNGGLNLGNITGLITDLNSILSSLNNLGL